MEVLTETHFEQAQHFSDELKAILRTPLTAETIDTYADDALIHLIELIQGIIAHYNKQPTIRFTSAREAENAALAYLGLQNVEATLDYLADSANEIHSLDTFIQAVPVEKRILLPPGSGERIAAEGDGELSQEKKIVPRLKTLLFILAHEYAVDLHNPEQLRVTRGTNDPTMMRSESYYLIQIPRLQRTVLVSDEVDNATFILDSSLLEQVDLKKEQVSDMTKTELGSLLSEHPELGQRLVYSNRYVSDLLVALTNPATTTTQEAVTPSFLIPPLPSGYRFGSTIASEWGKSYSVIKKAIDTLGEQLGERNYYRSTKGPREGFSPEQQDTLKQFLIEQGAFVELLPEGFLNAAGIAKEIGVVVNVVKNAIKELGDALGEAPLYKSSRLAHPAPGYSPEQQVLIIAYIEARGLLSKPLEDYHSFPQLCKMFGVSNSTLRRAVTELSAELGEITKHAYRGQYGDSFSPAQQITIEQYLQEKGYFSEPPEGYVNQEQLMKLLHVDHRWIKKAIEEIGAAFGEVKLFKFQKYSKRTPGYSPEQQQMLATYFNKSLS